MHTTDKAVIEQIRYLRSHGCSYQKIQKTTGAAQGTISKYLKANYSVSPRKLWGKVNDNTVRRQLDKKDLKRLRKGKEVSIKVQGLVVILSNKAFENPNQKIINRLDNRIALLEAKKKALTKEVK